ncbi:MAG: DNA-directed RNA polymerase subunit omega [Gemmatimonas sp.]|nr:DNA-directed RNA polymerase subunit omega [Gemmatimonas sp.]
MHVVTPGALARRTDSKYLGVLVAAKYARSLNEFTRSQFAEEPLPGELREKLTTTALEAVARGEVAFELVARRPSEV